jgi:outer membrane protein OmpA-like peptidoglycan-associated protein
MATESRRRRSLVVPVVVGVVGLAAISVGQDLPSRHGIEDNLRERSQHALQDAGINGADVRFVGRDGTVTLASSADKDRALSIVRGVNGVRVATVIAGEPVPEATAEPSPTVEPTPSPSPTASPTPTAPPVQEQLGALPTVTFENNSATLTPQGQAVVVNIANILKAHPTVKIRIEGHTDSRGAAAANLKLSQLRALAVLSALKAQGIAADRILAAGFGESRPKVPDTSDANRAINRRVELIVVQQ